MVYILQGLLIKYRSNSSSLSKHSLTFRKKRKHWSGLTARRC